MQDLTVPLIVKIKLFLEFRSHVFSRDASVGVLFAVFAADDDVAHGANPVG